MSSGTTDDPAYELIEMDSLDREAFRRARRRVSPLAKALERGANLVPEFEVLARDVFAVFYKYNAVRMTLAQQSPAAVFRGHIVDWVLAAPDLEKSKEVTRLDDLRAGLAAGQVLQGALRVATNPEWLDQNDLLQQWELQQLADQHQSLQDRLDAVEQLDEHVAEEGETRDALDAIAADLSGQQGDAEERMSQLAASQRRELERLPARAENLVKEAAGAVAQRLDEAERAADAYGHGLGMSSHGSSAVDKLTLGDHLLTNDKLKKLAELVGLFREVARSKRKRRLERRPSAIHSIDTGADLARVLTSELAFLRHPTRRKEFLRRYVDRLLAQYAIEADDSAGRGPLVVCLDASGSMRGGRELWAKAIALTLLEIARRERRAFRAIVFSGQAQEAKRFELLESALERRLRLPRVDPQLLVEFAEYFPAGGTEFETPLTLAIESLQESRFRGGDIVFITDGAAPISPSFLERLDYAKRALEFQVFAVLVDIQGGSPDSLLKFADEILQVSELTADALGTVFRKV